MKAFIFDVDGTLAETEELHRAAFNEAFAQEGLDWFWSVERYKSLLGTSGGKERMLRFIAEDAIAMPETASETVARLHAVKTQIYGRGVREGRLGLRPGVAALIAEARRRGIRLAIATTTSRDNVDNLLTSAFGGDGGFEVIACGDMVAQKKPAPDIYRLAMDELGLAPDACLAFEDSSNGLRAAQSAGLRCVVTPALYTQDEDLAGADLLVTDLGDQAAIFSLCEQPVPLAAGSPRGASVR